MNEEKQIMNIEPGSIQSVNAVKAQLDAVNNLYKTVMQKDLHYGVIPGTQKDTLLKPGAEKILIMFQLVAKIDGENIIDLPGGHRECRHIIGVYHKQSLTLWGQGTGACTSMESKYRYRDDVEVLGSVPKTYWQDRDNPEYKGMSTKKIDGNWKFVKKTGKIENPDPADVFNTVQKMSYKRALVAAVISATGISDIFNQDLEEINGHKPPEKSVAKALSKQVEEEFNGAFKDAPLPEKDVNGSPIEDIMQDFDNCSTMGEFLELNKKDYDLTSGDNQKLNKKKMATAKRLKGE